MSDIRFYQNIDDKSKFVVSNGPLGKAGFVELIPNSEDQALEKHVPEYEIGNNKIKVQVGSVVHPMIDTHYIMWIALVHGTEVKMIKLKPNELPEATFDYYEDSIIYAFCNLHGLWEKIVK